MQAAAWNGNRCLGKRILQMQATRGAPPTAIWLTSLLSDIISCGRWAFTVQRPTTHDILGPIPGSHTLPLVTCLLHVQSQSFPRCKLASCICISNTQCLCVMQQPQEVQDWLRDVCKSVIAAGGHNGVPLADWAPVVTDAFPPGEPDRVKHLRTQDFGDSTAVALPPEVRAHPAVEHVTRCAA